MDNNNGETKKKKRGGGRPSTYSEEKLQLARDYADGAWRDAGDVVPMIQGLAVYMGTSTDCVYEWRKHEDKRELASICARIMSEQGKSLINGGLTRSYDTGIAKLMLGKHGYSDRQEIDHSSKDGTMSPTTEAARDAARASVLADLGIDDPEQGE